MLAKTQSQISVEKEYKFLLTKNQYEDIFKNITNDVNISDKEKLQINYYYDTAAYDLIKHHITLRIRQIDDKCVMQVKTASNINAAYKLSKEEAIKVTDIPDFIQADDFSVFSQISEIVKLGAKNFYLQGSLVTKRISCKFDGASFDLDKNMYLGKCDYEAEIEFDNAETALELVKKYDLINTNKKSKASRFFEAKTREKHYV